MHGLPFGANLTDALYNLIVTGAKRVRKELPDSVPVIQWMTIDRKQFTKDQWGLLHWPRMYMQAHELFPITGTVLGISEADQERMRGLTLDWVAGKGIVASRHSEIFIEATRPPTPHRGSSTDRW